MKRSKNPQAAGSPSLPKVLFEEDKDGWSQVVRTYDAVFRPVEKFEDTGVVQLQRGEWFGRQRPEKNVRAVILESVKHIFKEIEEDRATQVSIYDGYPNFAVIFSRFGLGKYYDGLVKLDTLGWPSSIRIWPRKKMSAEGGTKTDEAQLRPRWAEEARPKKQVKLRLEPNLIDEVDSAASAEGKTRNDWIEDSIRSKLAANKPKPK